MMPNLEIRFKQNLPDMQLDFEVSHIDEAVKLNSSL